MNVLIVHQNFPGQFPHIADALIARGDKVAAIGSETAKGRPGVDLRRWSNKRSSTPNIFPHAVRAEADLIRAEAAAKAALQLRADGFMPDVIIGHPGWGETLHMKEVWPHARLILLGEMYYRTSGGDTGFDPEFGQQTFADSLRLNAKNATGALAYALADRIICPTPFQASSFPPGLRHLIRIQHEGVDLRRARRRPNASVKLPQHRGILTGDRPVITFVNRTLEPLRGFHIFMRALPALLDACPDAQIVIVGQNSPSGYGLVCPDNMSWVSWMLAELEGKLDLSRVHFMGQVRYDTLIDIFSISWAHVYYTYPFVLSWSLIEAMACECLVIASDTAPLHDAVTEGETGRLLPFFDVAALSVALVEAVRNPVAFVSMRIRARQAAYDGFDREAGVIAWLAEIDLLA